MVANSSTSASARKPIALALQGGGSWGAYTWGVLDGLLASRTFAIAQISGTSAGAINGAIVASALASGSTSDARKALRSFWMTVASPSIPNPAALWPAGFRWHDALGSWLLSTGVLSPYNANPLGINLLRDAIESHVDIDAIRRPGAPDLYITLTNVRTGRPRVVANDQMSVDALMASCALPHLFKAVEIDGEMYWDGGYSGNPTLWPMIHTRRTRDVVLVQLAPEDNEDLPTDALAIRQRVGEIMFNASLVAEMQAIGAMRAQAGKRSRVSELRFHRIGPPARSLYVRGSSLERSEAWLTLLHEEGRTAARQFIERNGADVGVRETLDIVKSFTDARKPKVRVAANEETFERAPVAAMHADSTGMIGA